MQQWARKVDRKLTPSLLLHHMAVCKPAARSYQHQHPPGTPASVQTPIHMQMHTRKCTRMCTHVNTHVHLLAQLAAQSQDPSSAGLVASPLSASRGAAPPFTPDLPPPGTPVGPIQASNWVSHTRAVFPHVYDPSYHTTLYELLFDAWLELGKVGHLAANASTCRSQSGGA